MGDTKWSPEFLSYFLRRGNHNNDLNAIIQLEKNTQVEELEITKSLELLMERLGWIWKFKSWIGRLMDQHGSMEHSKHGREFGGLEWWDMCQRKISRGSDKAIEILGGEHVLKLEC